MGRAISSFTSMSADCLIANAIARAIASGGISSLSKRKVDPSCLELAQSSTSPYRARHGQPDRRAPRADRDRDGRVSRGDHADLRAVSFGRPSEQAYPVRSSDLASVFLPHCPGRQARPPGPEGHRLRPG
jgi:hypothetical protein